MRKKEFQFYSFLLFLFCGNFLFAQTPQVWISETEIDFEIVNEGRFFHTFEFASRSMLSERINGNQTEGFEHEFVELTYAPVYLLSEQSELSLGVRYRWSDVFNAEEYDEIRLIPQYEYDHAIPHFLVSHSVRMESRFEGPEYVFRPRYEIGFTRILSKIFAIELSTEALWSISPQSIPEYEQRFAIELGNASLKNIELVVGFEYRLEDYVHSLEHEYFILTGASIEL